MNNKKDNLPPALLNKHYIDFLKFLLYKKKSGEDKCSPNSIAKGIGEQPTRTMILAYYLKNCGLVNIEEKLVGKTKRYKISLIKIKITQVNYLINNFGEFCK